MELNKLRDWIIHNAQSDPFFKGKMSAVHAEWLVSEFLSVLAEAAPEELAPSEDEITDFLIQQGMWHKWERTGMQLATATLLAKEAMKFALSKVLPAIEAARAKEKAEFGLSVNEAAESLCNQRVEAAKREGEQVGSKKVAEWIEARRLHPCKYCGYEYRFDEFDWQDKLKEWGLAPLNKEKEMRDDIPKNNSRW